MNIEDLKGCFANITDDDLLRDNGNLYAENKELKEEIERLNNIINELEKWLLEEHKKKQKWYNEQLSTNDKRYYEEKYLTSLTMINVFFDKIKELKGSDKE